MMSDTELEGELMLALLLLEANRPFKSWKDFSAWYRNEEASREDDRAAYFYRNKVPLEIQSSSEDDACEPTWLSDGGAGAERVYGPIESTRRKKLKSAEDKLRYRRKQHLIPVLRLIAKNVNNKEKSICELMRKPIKRQKSSTTAAARN